MTTLDALMQVQVGLEATDAWGTAVASTVKLMGVEDITITPVISAEQVNELRGTLQPGYREFIHAAHGEASVSGILEIDQFPLLLANLGGNDAGTTDAAGNFTYTMAAPTEDSDTEEMRPWTLIKGDGTDNYSLQGATITELTIEGESGGPVTYDASFTGKLVDTDTLDSLSDVVTKAAMGHMGSLWIDPGSDAMGTTAIANHAYSFSLNINTNRKFLTHIGDLNPSEYREGKWEGALSLSIEAGTDTYPYLDAIIGSTNTMPGKAVRLKFEAATDSYAQFDFTGALLEAPDLYSDEDGVVTFDFELVGTAGGATANFLTATVYSTVTTLE